MSEENKPNIVQIDINLDEYIKSSNKQQALDRTVSDQLRSNSFIKGLAIEIIQERLKDTVLKELSTRLAEIIKTNYDNPVAMEKIVKDNHHSITSKVREIMAEKTIIIESSIMKAMMSDGFQKRIADTVENDIANRMKNAMTSYDDD